MNLGKMKLIRCIVWGLFIFRISGLAGQGLTFQKLGPEINTDQYDEICPVITRNGRTLFFTRQGSPEFNRTLIYEESDLAKVLAQEEYFSSLKNIFSQIAGKPITDPIASQLNQDIWIADSRYGHFDQVYHPGFPLNNALPNSVCSLSPEDQTYVITNHFYRDGSLQKGFSFIHRKADRSFQFPEPIFIKDFYSNSPEVNFTMSRDADVIILSLLRDHGIGDMDLFICFRLKENLWSEPINMGPVINSSSRDLTPFISHDKSKLFFASNRPGGFGGTDIYVTDRLDLSWKKWSEPKLLPQPINSEADDSNPILTESGEDLYFTSRRDGSSDIFKAQYQEPVAALAEPIILKGHFRHAHTEEILDGNLLFGSRDMQLADLTILPITGQFTLTLDRSEIYRFSPRKPGYIGKSQLVDVTILRQDSAKAYEIDFYLSPLPEDQKLDFQNIYFERGTDIVRTDSYEELDRLAVLLKSNPGAQIRIEGHTDSVGIDYELIDLSRKRAESIKKYLVLEKKIGSHRITTVGHGGHRPISPNNTEKNRAKNRRVEIYLTRDQQKSLQVGDLREPKVIVHYEPLEILETIETKAPISELEKEVIDTEVPKNKAQAKAPKQKTQSVFGTIQFVENELAIKQLSFDAIHQLITTAQQKPKSTIVLSGHCAKDEKVSFPETFSLQRAKGVKEYLVFKSIAPDRIRIDDNKNNQDLAGVKVMLEE
jgi:outer membrane protein OmpA-like peptidoglycan-associated protein